MWEVPRLGSGRARIQTRFVFRALLHVSCLPRSSRSWWTHSVCRVGSGAPPESPFPGPVQSATPLLQLSDQGFLEQQGEMGTEGRFGFSLCPLLTFLIPTCKGTVACLPPPPPPPLAGSEETARAKLSIPCLRGWGPHSTLGREEMVVDYSVWLALSQEGDPIICCRNEF